MRIFKIVFIGVIVGILCTGCGSSILDKDQATELLSEIFPFKVEGNFCPGASVSQQRRNRLVNRYEYLIADGLLELETIQVQNPRSLFRKDMLTEYLFKVPDTSSFLIESKERVSKSRDLFQTKTETVYTVVVGQLNFLQVTGIFQEKDSEVAEIEFEVFFEFNRFNDFAESYTNLSPIKNPDQNEYCLKMYQKRGKDEDIGTQMKLKAIAKKYNTGWKIEAED